MNVTTAVVTGAGSGLGRAIAMRLARPGVKLLLADINIEACQETARMVEGRGATAHAQTVDVSDAAQVAALADEADRRLGRIDLVVNNAGVAAAGLIGDAPLDDWRWIISINLMGVIHGCHASRRGSSRRAAARSSTPPRWPGSPARRRWAPTTSPRPASSR